MSASLRYSPAQLGEAIRRSARGGDPRDFLVLALISLPGEQAQAVMRSLLDDHVLQAREWGYVIEELATRDSDEFVPIAIREGLVSRSVEVQQRIIDFLAEWDGVAGLDHKLVALVRAWLDRRMRNPKREATADPWEVVDVALVLLRREGAQAAHDELAHHYARMDSSEREHVEALPSADSDAFAQHLWEWRSEQRWEDDEIDERYPDPTATRYIDKIMRRLNIEPSNPDVETFVEDWENFEPDWIVIDEDDLGDDHPARA